MSDDLRLADGAFPIKIGEQEYQCSMLTDRDYADLTGWIQSRYIETARNVDRESLITDGSDDRDLLKFALATATKITWGTVEGAEILSSTEGMLRLGWQMTRKRHPRLEYKEFRKTMESTEIRIQALEQIHTAYNQLHKIPENGDGRSSGEKS